MNVSWIHFVKIAAAEAKQPAAIVAKAPEKVVGKNNPFNMRNYFQGWVGEDLKGLKRGDMLNFSSQFYGWRAGARNMRNILMRLKAKGIKPTIRNFTPVISPAKGDYMANENNVNKHMGNISMLSMIGLDDEIDPNDSTKFFKFLTGLAMAESGAGALSGMTADDIRRAIASGRTSIKK